MQTIFSFINKPLGIILESIAGLVGGNFAASVFIFTLLINLVLIPLNLKSQKSAVQQLRIKPKLDDLKKRFGDDKQKYNEAMQKLYQEEKISLSGGCLPMILRLVFMMSIYYLIMQPLTYLMHIPTSTIEAAKKAIDLGSNFRGNAELQIISAVRKDPSLSPEISAKLDDISFNLFGIDLTETPKFSFDIFNDFKLIWLIPILAFAAQMLTSVLSMHQQKKQNPDAPNMAFMMLSMPLMSLFIGFTLPGGVGFYWICSSLIGGLIQYFTQEFYGPNKILARERVKELSAVADTQIKQKNNAVNDAAEN